jgi:FkbM family methyltransferase
MNYYDELEKMQTIKFNPAIVPSDCICLYGAGALGQMAMDCMDLAGIEVSRIFDKEKTGNINGVKIESLNNITEDECSNILLLVTICTLPYESVVQYLQGYRFKQVMPFYTYAYLKFPQILSNGWYINDMPNHIEDIRKICEMLKHDDLSLHHYLSFLWWKCTGKEIIYHKFPILSQQKYFKSPNMIKISKLETFLDCGCHYGDTIKQFLEITQGLYKQIYAFEPDISNLKVAMERFPNEEIIWDSRGLADKSGSLYFCDGMGFASKLVDHGEQRIDVVSIDDLEIAPSIIKIHVEGAEYSVLEGAYETIMRYRPFIMVFADHSADGLYKIPNLVTQYKDYSLYFNYCDYCGNSAIFYMIPNERINEV